MSVDSIDAGVYGDHD